MFRSVLTSALALSMFVTPALAQSDDNRGTDFTIGFMANLGSNGELVLFITGDLATTGTVNIPGLTFSSDFTVAPGAVTSVSVPLTARASSEDGVENLGIKITADDEIVVYGLNQITATTDAFLALPTDILGTDHVVLGFDAASSTEDSEFMVVATEDNTTVTIVPSMTTATRTEGVSYTVTLDALETYQLVSDSAGDDVSGTIVTSDKPVAVFGGARCTDVPTDASFCDHLVEQIPPTATWGRRFLTAPLATRLAGDIFRIVSRDDATDIFIDGAFEGSINRGEVFEVNLASGTFHEITTSGPTLLAQYSLSSTTDGVTSDPFQMLVPPVEQFLDGYTLTTPDASPVSFTNFINVVVPTADTAACTLDGGPITATFTAIGATGFSGAQLPVAIGAHNLACPNGFGAYSYGFASFDSYGYPGGLALAPIAEEDRCILGVEQVRFADRTFTSSRIDSHGTAELGTDAESDTVFANGKIFLRNRSIVNGDAVSTDDVKLQATADVTGEVKRFEASIDLPEVPTVADPGVGSGNLVVNSGSSTTLTPGLNGEVIVNSNATLVLDGAGVYSFTRLTVNSGATVEYSEDAEIVVRDAITWRGTQVGTGPLNVSQTGSGWSHFETSFDGAIVAPDANVRLQGNTQPVFQGESFVAKQLLVETGATVECLSE